MLTSTLARSRRSRATGDAPEAPGVEPTAPASPAPEAAAGGSRPRSRLHVAIIMDGNGRWAEQRGVPRTQGHRAGVETVRRIVSAAPRHGIGTLTLYAFSSDNWRRPPLEVKSLMRLFRKHLRSEADRLVEEGVRVSVIGRRDRLSPALVDQIESLEQRTRAGRRLRLQLAIDYSARDAIVQAARLARVRPVAAGEADPRVRPVPDSDDLDRTRAIAAGDALDRDAFGRLVARALHVDGDIPDVDLLVRTAGEQRLSDFLLWECAYAELYFTTRLWPDFDQKDLALALREFDGRERRYGGLPQSQAEVSR